MPTPSPLIGIVSTDTRAPRLAGLDTPSVTTGTGLARGPQITAALVAFVGPWLLLAMASPLYSTRWLPLTLLLWVLGIATGAVCTMGRQESRRVGVAVLVGTLLGCALFVLIFGVVLFTAGDWD